MIYVYYVILYYNKVYIGYWIILGYEISGIVDEIGPDVNTKLRCGDKVLLYQEEDIGFDNGWVRETSPTVFSVPTVKHVKLIRS